MFLIKEKMRPRHLVYSAFYRVHKVAEAARDICAVCDMYFMFKRTTQGWLAKFNSDVLKLKAGQYVTILAGVLDGTITGDKKFCLHINMKQRKGWINPGDMREI